jgi:hypothetical protein
LRHRFRWRLLQGGDHVSRGKRKAGHTPRRQKPPETHPDRNIKHGISVFLSYPKPCFGRQEAFVSKISKYLSERGMAPRTLGVTDYDMDAPLTAIRRLMLESNGLITIAFRRTTPWAHIEPSMAYQIGLPVLILREKDVLADGVLERGVLGLYMPEFDLDKSIDDYFQNEEWKGMIGKWEGYVRAVVDRKGRPPGLF